MSLHKSTADQLGEMIGAVRAEKAKVDIESRHAKANSNNQRAQRLVKRLQECDTNIASLLSQAADCLQVLVTTSANTSSKSIREIQEEEEKLARFETKAQEWYATLHDVQIGLRSAAKNLRKIQQPPLSTQASNESFVGGNKAKSSNLSTNQTRLGSATKGHSMAITFSGTSTPVYMGRKGSEDSIETVRANAKASRSAEDLSMMKGQNEKPGGRRSLLNEFLDVEEGSGVMQMRREECDEESKLSLSALRQQQKGWRQLADALSTMASDRKKEGGDQDVEMQMTTTTKNHIPPEEEKRQLVLRNAEASMTRSFSNSDQRLMNALMHLYMEVLPETSIAPITAPKKDESMGRI